MPRGISIYQFFAYLFDHEVNAYSFSLVNLIQFSSNKIVSFFSLPKENYLSDDLFHKKNHVSYKIHIPFSSNVNVPKVFYNRNSTLFKRSIDKNESKY